MNDVDIPAFFTEHGTELKTDARTPLALRATEHVYCVTRGKVNLFYSALDETRGLVGHKSHVFTALPGDGLWGLGDSTAAGTFVGSSQQDTVLHSLETERLDEVPDLQAALADVWIAHIFSGLGVVPLPKNSIHLAGAEERDVRLGEAVYAAEDLCWIEVLDGTFVYQDREELPVPAEGILFPLTGSAWVTALGKGRIRAVTTAELARRRGLLPALKAFHERALALYDCREKVLSDQERERLEQKKGLEDAYLRSSLESLADVVTLKGPPLSRGPSPDNPLFAACRTVGMAMGMNMVLPKRNPRQLASIINASHLRTRRVALEENWWKTDNGPLLGFLETVDTPVALIPESRTRYRMWDPTTDIWRHVDNDVAGTIKPFAVALYRSFPHKKLAVFDLLRYGMQNAWAVDAVTVVLVGLLSGLLGLVIPVATGFIFDSLVPRAERGQLLQLGLFLGLGAAAGFVFQIARSIASLRLESRMNASIQASVWDRLLSLPMPFFRGYSTGDLAVRAGSINAIRRMVSGAAMSVLFSGVFSIFNFLALFYYSRSLAVTATILVAISIVLTVVSSIVSLERYKEVWGFNGKLSGLILQLINGIAKLQVSGALNRVFHLWTNLFSRKRKAEFKARTISNIFGVFQGVFPLVCSLVIFYRAAATPDLVLSTGTFLAFSASFAAFMSAMLALSGTFISLLVIVPQFERAQPILHALPEYRDDKADPGDLNGDIEVNHVRFRYHRSGPLILEDVNLRIRPGEFVALVGPSGAGKSTLLRLLLGLETASSGAITMDGMELNTLDLRSVRQQIGTVLQNSRIMPGDVFHNIIGASAELTINDAWEAAEMAGLAEDIREMPMGMFTVISEGGTTISGGQRQRLLIARALVNRPRILYFDEATSALDNRTQDIVGRSLERLNATRLVIAHRLSTIVNADKIIVMDKGRIVEQGTYGELLSLDKAFAELARRQLA